MLLTKQRRVRIILPGFAASQRNGRRLSMRALVR